MTPEYILRKSLCRAPSCAGPSDLRNTPLKDWPEGARASYLRHAECEIDNMDYATEYGEPGYDNPDKCILLANWNYFNRDVCDLLGRAGYALAWSDEWEVNHDGNMKAYRTQPDSYGWQPSLLYLDDGTTIAADEVREGRCVDEYIEHLLNRPSHCDTFNIDWSQHGFERMTDRSAFERGLHPWQTDDPEKILAEYQKRYPGKDFLFSLDRTGQFDAAFSIWGRDKDEED